MSELNHEKVQAIIELDKEYSQIQKAYFFEYNIFSFQWWLLVGITILLWVVWLCLVNKRRLQPILIVGMFTSILAIIFDDIGLSEVAWNYPYRMMPFTSRMNPVDLCVIPVSYMLLYQFLVSWRSYIIGILGFSLFAAFIAEPIFVKLNMYVTLTWEYWYSAPIYFAIGLFTKWFVDWTGKNSGLRSTK